MEIGMEIVSVGIEISKKMCGLKIPLPTDFKLR